MAGYIYTLAFGIFMTDAIRVPAPLILGIIPLFFMDTPLKNFAYHRELLLFIIALFLYNVVGAGDYKSFAASFIIVILCSSYFNYFVGTSRRRYNSSVYIFYLLLAISMFLMVLDHNFQSIIDPVRAIMLGEEVKQSPAGIATTQFTFGYQLAAFTAFLFIAVIAFRQRLLIKGMVLAICLTCLYLGMNRSAFVCFAVVVGLFSIIYYRFKAVLLITAVLIIGFGMYTYVLKGNIDDKNNILAKNQAKQANDFNRGTMAVENLKIYEDYPYGLIFYGKTWEDVTYRNPLFPFGLTSHNAYLMFLTYLGPFLGLGILIAIYYRVIKLFWQCLKSIHLKNNALFISLLFSFFAVSLNAFSHNGWLLSVDGPTIFLYFAVLHYSHLEDDTNNKAKPVTNRAVETAINFS